MRRRRRSKVITIKFNNISVVWAIAFILSGWIKVEKGTENEKKQKISSKTIDFYVYREINMPTHIRHETWENDIIMFCSIKFISYACTSTIK